MPARRPLRQPPFHPAETAPRPASPVKEPERSARPFVPESRSLPMLKAAAAGCQGCDLYLRATQVVFGSGRRRATMMLVGEQPGDKEDLEGEPFVGPAGAMLKRALQDAGVDPEAIYVTNAVKHFSWEPRGKRRIHKKPRASEIRACHPWLDTEIALVKPRVIVCLGATAAQALLGAQFRVTAHRGAVVPSPLPARVLATVHPSSILRSPDEETRREELRRFTDDLRAAARALSSD